MADNFYNITLSNGFVLGEVFDSVVANNGADTSLTSLALIRRGANAYAEPTSLSLVHILENFSNGSPPVNPLVGQLWYDTAAKKIKVYDPTNSGFTSVDGSGLATGLVNAVTIALAGDMTGSTSFDGTSNVVINSALANMPTPVAGTYFSPRIVVDQKGRIISAVNSNAISNTGGVITGSLTLSSGDFNVANGKVQENGFSLVPSGVIVMWSGASIPAGWLLCDGTHGTPNLKGRFIVGADAAGGYTINTTNGIAQQNNLSVTSSGAHVHDVQTATAGAHNHLGLTGTHVLSVAELPPHTHSFGPNGFREVGSDLAYSGGGSGATTTAKKETLSTGNGVGHNHTISSGGDHTHTANTSSSGDHIHTLSFDNRPPYYVLAYIMKA